MSIPTLQLAGKKVGKMGYGLMQLTWTPHPPADEVSFAAMKAAADAGATAWSTATFYGPPDHSDANLALIGRFFKKYPEYSDKVCLVMKGGAKEASHYSGDLDFNRDLLKNATSLIGRKIDIYSYARIPDDTPFEKLFENLKTLKEEGWFTEVGASETKAETLEKAHKIVPISIVEIEVSLWAYEPSTKAVIEWSQKTKVPVFAYAPLGRGFITRKWSKPEDIPEGSFQKALPRFQGEAFYENLKLVDQLDELAEKKGLTTGELALAWVSQLSPYNIPIPGSSSVERVKQNTEAVNIKLSEADLEGVNAILEKFEVKGGRYMAGPDKQLMR